MKHTSLFHKLFDKKFVSGGRNVLGFLAILFFLLVGWYGIRCSFEKVCTIHAIDKLIRHSAEVIAPNGSFDVEIADTKSSRELGLSGRKSLGDGEGLLFVFDAPGQYGFWMKDMLFPLDIVWINNKGFVVEVERNAKPESYPKTFINIFPASYVLEINAGEAEGAGIYIGSKVKIER